MRTLNPRLQIDAAEPIGAKVDKIQRFLGEEFFDDLGIMYAMWHWSGDELRPFAAGDFDGISTFITNAGTGMHDLENYENSTYTSGLFLWSQVLRHRATGDAQALEYAAKAFRSLELIYDLGVQNHEPGLLCKPYGHAFSRETSPDQYLPVLMGFWEYRMICDKPTRLRIDEMLPAMADWWRLRDYKIVYFDKEGDWLNGANATPQYGPEYIAMNSIAHKITGDAVYRAEADRILALVGDFATRYDLARQNQIEHGKAWWPEQLHGREYDAGRRDYIQLDWESYSPIWFSGAAAEWLFVNEPAMQPLLSHVIANYYRVIKANLTDDLMSPYWSQTDLGTGKSYPVACPRYTNNWQEYVVPFNWSFCGYISEFYHSDAAWRAGDMAMLAYRYAPQFSPGALELVRDMLARLDSRRLLSMIDLDGDNLEPNDRWIGSMLSSESPAGSVLTYWRARCWGIELESPA